MHCINMPVPICYANYLRYAFLAFCASAQTKHTPNLSITSRTQLFLGEVPASSLLFKAMIG